MHQLDVSYTFVTCPNCRTRNRVGPHVPSENPVCGRCGASLATVVALLRAAQNPATVQKPAKSRTKRLVIVSAVLGALAVGSLFVLIGLSTTGGRAQTPAKPAPVQQAAPQAPKPVTQTQPKPKPVPQLNRRLANGTVIRSNLSGSKATFTVKNGLSVDAAVKLINKASDRCIAFFYVCSSSDFTLSGIPDGEYRMIFSTGEDWDEAAARFTRKRHREEFEKTAHFVTTKERKSDGIMTYFKRFEITLHPVKGGNAPTHIVSAKSFVRNGLSTPGLGKYVSS